MASARIRSSSTTRMRMNVSSRTRHNHRITSQVRGYAVVMARPIHSPQRTHEGRRSGDEDNEARRGGHRPGPGRTDRLHKCTGATATHRPGERAAEHDARRHEAREHRAEAERA